MQIIKKHTVKISCIALVILAVSGCDNSSDSSVQGGVNPVEQSRVVGPQLAKLFVVGDHQRQGHLSFPAVIQSSQLTLLSFEVGGIVNEVKVVEAQRVQKGEVLATLDKRVLESELASARAQYVNAKQEYARAAKLIKHKAISDSELEERKLALEVSEAKFATAEKSLQDAVLVAPFAAAVAKVEIKAREVVQSGSPAITLLGEAGLEAKINLPADIIARSRLLQDKVPQAVHLALDAAPQRSIPARFKEASLQADSASQTYAVIFTFIQPADLNILPGMNAVISFSDPRVNGLANYPQIPLRAIVSEGERHYVWLVAPSTMTVSKRYISIAAEVGEFITVTEGLANGDTLVVAGMGALNEGMPVTRWNK